MPPNCDAQYLSLTWNVIDRCIAFRLTTMTAYDPME